MINTSWVIIWWFPKTRFFLGVFLADMNRWNSFSSLSCVKWILAPFLSLFYCCFQLQEIINTYRKKRVSIIEPCRTERGSRGSARSPSAPFWNGRYWRTQQLFPSTTLRRGPLVPTAPGLFSFDDEEFSSLLYVYRNSLFLLASKLVREHGVWLQSKGDPAASLADARRITVF